MYFVYEGFKYSDQLGRKWKSEDHPLLAEDWLEITEREYIIRYREFIRSAKTGEKVQINLAIPRFWKEYLKIEATKQDKSYHELIRDAVEEKYFNLEEDYDVGS